MGHFFVQPYRTQERIRFIKNRAVCRVAQIVKKNIRQLFMWQKVYLHSTKSNNMKNTILLLLAIISFGSPLSAQLSDTGELPEKYRAVFLGFGPRSLDTSPGTIVTSYTDDSPSMDMFTGSFEVEDSYSRLGTNFGYKWGRYGGLSHKIMVDISLGSNVGGLVTYGLGYNFSRIVGGGILTINPGLFGGFGNYGFGIGAIENNAVFIQVGSTEFYDSSVDLNLKSQLFVYGPELTLDYALADHFSIWLNAAYDLASDNSRPSLEFQGGDTTAAIDLEGSSAEVTYNGAPINALPYEASGVRVSVGVAYVWNRY